MILFKDTTAFIVGITLLIFLIASGKTSVYIPIRSQNVSCVNDKIDVEIPKLDGLFHVTLSVVMTNANNRQIQLRLIKYRNERLIKSVGAEHTKSTLNTTIFWIEEYMKIDRDEHQKMLCYGNDGPLRKIFISSGRITLTELPHQHFIPNGISPKEATIESTLSEKTRSTELHSLWLKPVFIIALIMILLLLAMGFKKLRHIRSIK